MKNVLRKLALLINGLMAMLLIIFLIKDKDSSQIEYTSDTSDSLEPVSANISKTQDAINTDRENKLRQLNNSPKEIIQQTTNKTTTTTTPSTSTSTTTKPKTSTKTKTS